MKLKHITLFLSSREQQRLIHADYTFSWFHVGVELALLRLSLPSPDSRETKKSTSNKSLSQVGLHQQQLHRPDRQVEEHFSQMAMQATRDANRKQYRK